MINEFALYESQMFHIGYKGDNSGGTSKGTIPIPPQKGRRLISQQGLCDTTDCLFCVNSAEQAIRRREGKPDLNEDCGLNFHSNLVALAIFPSVFLVVAYLILKFWVRENR